MNDWAALSLSWLKPKSRSLTLKLIGTRPSSPQFQETENLTATATTIAVPSLTMNLPTCNFW
jgi:hypothetical protein